VARIIIAAAALIAAALIALLVPTAREILAAAGIGALLILGNIQIGHRQLSQARKAHAIVEQTSRRVASLL
jgi:hypothetical protein